jgi:hypothetical protein
LCIVFSPGRGEKTIHKALNIIGKRKCFYNQRAITLYEKLGFQREGVFPEHLERDGTRFDTYLYGILRPEWLAMQT